MSTYQRTREKRRRSKRFERAFHAHEKSKRKLQKAASDIERFTYCLFGALKFQEKAVADWQATLKKYKAEERRLAASRSR